MKFVIGCNTIACTLILIGCFILEQRISKLETELLDIEGELKTVQHFANSQNDYMEHLKFEKEHLAEHLENLTPEMIEHLNTAHGIKVRIK